MRSCKGCLQQSCRSWYNGSYNKMAKPMKTLELHHPMIQFLIMRLLTLSVVVDSNDSFLGSQYNECQRLCHGKTKYVPVHDVLDQNFLSLPFCRHI